ncbi:MAG: hypothetical protein MUC56_13420 [Thermoanaerobaculales bacterium]|jgi:hypothetical protein|nr:hypothetical protein [Thermoanaerobaculales bacterium]
MAGRSFVGARPPSFSNDRPHKDDTVNAKKHYASQSTPGRIAVGVAAAVVVLLTAGAVAADDLATLADVTRARVDGAQTVAQTDEAIDTGLSQEDSAWMAETWGIEVTSIRLTANDHMIDFRYRVLDSAKASDLFVRQTKPALIHQETGRVLAVPETAKVGPLRNSNQPQEGKIYWMFFGNAGNLVHTGDQVTVKIGDFTAENLVVE